MSTFLDVSTMLCQLPMCNLTNRNTRPTNFRGIDVWYLPAAEEDETYPDHSHVVPPLIFG